MESIPSQSSVLSKSINSQPSVISKGIYSQPSVFSKPFTSLPHLSQPFRTNMAPTKTTSDQEHLLTQSDPASSKTVALTFGIVTVVLSIMAIAIAWKQYQKHQNVPQAPSITYNAVIVGSQFAAQNMGDCKPPMSDCVVGTVARANDCDVLQLLRFCSCRPSTSPIQPSAHLEGP